MATHDYVIDNSTGANVRADINLVLQAILTNNSSSSAPSTTAAYMWWADTTNGVLKIRNSSNNDWVELLQLDGTLTLEDGSASTPALAFRDDLNTGIFSSAADTFNVATAGVERMELGTTTIFNEDGADVDFRIEGDTDANLFYVDAGNDRVGIGTSSPSSPFTVSDGNQGFEVHPNSSSTVRLLAFDRTNSVRKNLRIDALAYEIQCNNGTEKIRIDSSGKVGIGTTNPLSPLHVRGSGTTNLRVDNSDDGTAQLTLGNTGSSNLVIAQASANATFSIGGSELMRIDSSGRVLIGTTTEGNSSADNLTVADSGESGITVRSGTSQGGHIYFSDATSGTAEYQGAISYQHNGDFMKFNTSAIERMRLDNSGMLLFGKTADDSTTGSGILISNNGNMRYSHTGTGDHDFLEFNRGTDGSMNRIGLIRTSGSGTIYNTTSDYRLKENAVAISDGITRLKTLKPYRFNFKIEPDKTVDGFFAHEVTAVPEAITGTKDEVDSDNKPVYQGIDQSKLVPLLVAAVQELITKVETLEAA